jgi:hypothetical protein
MDVSRVGVSCLLILLMSITSAHAEENRYCAAEDWNGTEPTTRIATWRAGTVTAGKPSQLQVAFDSSASKCGGRPCMGLEHYRWSPWKHRNGWVCDRNWWRVSAEYASSPKSFSAHETLDSSHTSQAYSKCYPVLESCSSGHRLGRSY